MKGGSRAAPRRRRAGADVAGLRRRRGHLWPPVAACLVVLVLVGVLAYHLVPKISQSSAGGGDQAGQSTVDIDGVVEVGYPAGRHVVAPQRVAYDRSPPFGGPHDQIWATCTGVVYPTAIRSENAIHSLEHGAVWITYDPARIDGAALSAIERRAAGVPYTMLSPYPGLQTPISVQAWGRQLAVKTADDERIDRFLTAARRNSLAPELGASCATIPGGFDPADPPAFDPGPPGPDALPMPAVAGGSTSPVPTPGVR